MTKKKYKIEYQLSVNYCCKNIGIKHKLTTKAGFAINEMKAYIIVCPELSYIIVCFDNINKSRNKKSLEIKKRLCKRCYA